MKRPKQLPAVDRRSTQSASAPAGANARASGLLESYAPYLSGLSPYLSAL